MTSSADWMSRLALDHFLVDHLLGKYRAIQYYFPFVVIQPQWTAASMLQSHPTLLLAAITAVSTYYPRLQHALAETFHNLITNKVLTAEGTTLDLLEGILVHLAW